VKYLVQDTTDLGLIEMIAASASKGKYKRLDVNDVCETNGCPVCLHAKGSWF